MELLIEIVVYSWLITFAFCISISLAYPLLKKYYDNGFEALIPLYNIFILFKAIGYTSLLGFLFLLPIINIFMMHVLGYGLSKKVKTYLFFKVGYVILPIIFIPLSACFRKKESNKKEKNKEEKIETFEVEEDLEDEEILDESIFKLKAAPKEAYIDENKPYKAKKVEVNQKLIDSDPIEQERVEKVEKKKKN